MHLNLPIILSGNSFLSPIYSQNYSLKIIAGTPEIQLIHIISSETVEAIISKH